MLSIETENLIENLFMKLSETEIEIEVSRKNLCSQPGFEPYQIFKRFDRESKNFVTEGNIIDFLHQNSVYCTDKEAKYLILFYDTDKSRSLTYSQFLNIILCDGAHNKRTITKMQVCKHLPYAIEFSVCRVFEKEINLVRTVDNLITHIKQRRDFSVFDVFRTIKGEGDFVTGDALANFLLRNRAKFNGDDIKRIIKKLDIDKNGYVTMEDLETIFNYGESYQSRASRLTTLNSQSMNLFSTSETPMSNMTTPKEKVSDTLSLRPAPIRKSPEPTQSTDFTTVNSRRYFMNQSDSMNLIGNQEKINTESLLSFISMIMDVEIKIEKCKYDLAIRADFNMEDAFRFFEGCSHSFITQRDVQKVFDLLGIVVSYDDIQLLVKKYDLNGQNALSYADLFDLLVPFDKDYRKIVEERTASPYSFKRSKENIFFTSTKIVLKNLLEMIIESERMIEKEREKLSKIFTLNVRDFYNKIDKMKNGYFSVLDLNLFLKSYQVIYIPKEADLLFIRLDRKREGKISLNDFIYETVPKLEHFK